MTSITLVVPSEEMVGLVRYIQKLGTNRGAWREVFEPQNVGVSVIEHPERPRPAGAGTPDLPEPLHRLSRAEGRRQRRRRHLPLAEAARLHVRGLQVSLDAERVAADRRGPLPHDHARRALDRHAHLARALRQGAHGGGGRLHQDLLLSVQGGGPRAAAPDRRASEGHRRAGRPRQGALREGQVLPVPWPGRQGRRPVRRRDEGTSPASRSAPPTSPAASSRAARACATSSGRCRSASTAPRCCPSPTP